MDGAMSVCGHWPLSLVSGHIIWSGSVCGHWRVCINCFDSNELCPPVEDWQLNRWQTPSSPSENWDLWYCAFGNDLMGPPNELPTYSLSFLCSTNTARVGAKAQLRHNQSHNQSHSQSQCTA